jgi:hypothetical protein
MAAEGIQSNLDPELSGDDSVFSVMALIAMLLSFASAGVLATTNLIPLSVAAIILGLIPLIASRRWGLSNISIFFAATAVTLGILFVSWSATRRYLMDQRLALQATKYAFDYIDILNKKDMETAFRMGFDLNQVDEMGKEAPSMYNTREATAITQSGFINNGARREIIDRGESAKWTVVKYQIRPSEHGHAVRLSLQDKSITNPRTIGIMMLRERNEKTPAGTYYWSVGGMQMD